MAWAVGPTNPKYRSKEHRDERARLVRQLKSAGYLTCTAVECVMPSRVITNPNGNAADGLHAGHKDDGITYAGPQHRACNVRDGAKRGNAKARGVQSITRWLI